MLALADARWVEANHNILIVGPTGIGKTYTACALAQTAIRRGHTAFYMRAPRMLDELSVARVDGRLPRLLAAWARVDVLVIDDLGLQALTNQQAADLLEVIEDRHQRHATIVTSQLPVKQWHEALGEPTIADAILDRLLNNSHRFDLSGPSLRDPKSLDAELDLTTENGAGRAEQERNTRWFGKTTRYKGRSGSITMLLDTQHLARALETFPDVGDYAQISNKEVTLRG